MNRFIPSNNGGGAWKTVPRACDGARPGDIIEVADGTHVLTRTANLKQGVAC